MRGNVRTASHADALHLLPLVEEYWAYEGIPGFDPELVRPVITRLLSEPALGAGWLLDVDGQAVGYLLAVYMFSVEHLGLTAEIDEFYVQPAHRGIGAGTTLITAAEAGFRRAGCTRVSLQLSRLNGPARSFYRTHHYQDRAGYELLDKCLK
jgi:GNAT superfamily N-acetyltransferase